MFGGGRWESAPDMTRVRSESSFYLLTCVNNELIMRYVEMQIIEKYIDREDGRWLQKSNVKTGMM